MSGLETIKKYQGAKRTLEMLYGLLKWVSEKLGKLYICNHGWYEFDNITLNGDRYTIDLRWHTEDETTFEHITVPKELGDKLFDEDTRDEAYAELERIHDEEMKIIEAERQAEAEKRKAEQEKLDKEKRREQYEEFKKEFG